MIREIGKKTGIYSPMDIASMEPLVPTEDKRSLEDEGFLDAKVRKATWPGPERR